MGGLLSLKIAKRPLITSYTAPGVGVNEDAFAYTDGCAVVIDGATSLNKDHRTEWGSDPQWFSHSLVKEIVQVYEHDPSCDAEDLLSAAISKVAASQEGALYHHDLERAPVGSLVWVRWDDSYVEVVNLGDATVIARLGQPAELDQSGTSADFDVRFIHNSIISQLDRSAIERMVQLSKERHIPIRECRPLINDLLEQNRHKHLTHPAYNVVSLDPAISKRIEIVRYPRQAVFDVLLMSDGYADTVANAHLYEGWGELVEAAKESIETPAKRLRSVYDSDPDFTQFPRFKHCDDTTAVYVGLTSC